MILLFESFKKMEKVKIIKFEPPFYENIEAVVFDYENKEVAYIPKYQQYFDAFSGLKISEEIVKVTSNNDAMAKFTTLDILPTYLKDTNKISVDELVKRMQSNLDLFDSYEDFKQVADKNFLTLKQDFSTVKYLDISNLNLQSLDFLKAFRNAKIVK